MSADLDEFEEQITELLKSIKNSLEKEVPSLKGQERSEKCQYLRNRLNRAKQVHRAIVVELRGLTGADSSVWEGKAKDFEEQIARHLQDVEWAEANNTAAGGNAAAPKKKNIEEMQTQEITKHALMIQDKTQASTGRAKQALEETIQIGISANDELKRQGEKLKEVEQDLDTVEANLKRADKQLRIFVRL